MVEPSEFDIYQTEAGYVAVTNEVRRKILVALAKKPCELTELVKITGKAKPTLSNLHVRELLAQQIIEELPHPTDQRKKVYRLKGARIGSSNIPIEQLRGAVKQYVARSPMAHAIPLQQVLDVLLAGGPRSHATIARQASKLGELSAQLFGSHDVREALPKVAAYLEREGITRTAHIDFENEALELDVNPRYLELKDGVDLVAALLGGFVSGAISAASMRGTAVGSARVRLEKSR